MSDDIKMVIVVRKDLNMRKGKMAAQVAHAAMEFMRQGYLDSLKAGQSYYAGGTFVSSETPTVGTDGFWDATYTLTFPAWQQGWYATLQQQKWLEGNHAKIVVSVDSEAALLGLVEKAKAAGVTVYPITDHGLTEFHGVHTLTCAAFGPDSAEKIDSITGGLPLI